MPFDIDLPDFCACAEKLESRQNTIIDLYKKYICDKLPSEKQYWTMCAMQTNKQGVFQNGSELGQMLENGLITEEQFYGVDINENFIEANRRAKPNAHWFLNDFLIQMKKAHKEGWLEPAVVFADLLSMEERGAARISEIMYFLESRKKNNVMLVGNMMITNPHARHHITYKQAVAKAEKIVDQFYKHAEFRNVWRTGKWKAHDKYYLYNGTGKKSTTKMVTFIFYKN